MKKIMFMLLFIVGCMTSLAALNLDPPNQVVISQSMEWGDEAPMTLSVQKEVNILHRDSLMYSSKEYIDSNIKRTEINGVICAFSSDKLSAKFEVGWQNTKTS